MTITLNGQAKTIEGPITAADLITGACPRPEIVICELNGAILNRNLWNSTRLNPNDAIELVALVGGG